MFYLNQRPKKKNQLIIQDNMPKVGTKHFPYTKKGRAAAKKARARLRKKSR